MSMQSSIASTLSQREQEIAELVADGCTNVEIARLLGLAPSTVKNHLKNIYAKTGIHSAGYGNPRVLLAIYWHRQRERI